MPALPATAKKTKTLPIGSGSYSKPAYTGSAAHPSKFPDISIYVPTTPGDDDLPVNSISSKAFADHRLQPNAHDTHSLTYARLSVTNSTAVTSQDVQTTYVYTPAPWYERTSTHIIGIILFMILVVGLVELCEKIGRCIRRRKGGVLRLSERPKSKKPTCPRSTSNPGFFDLDVDDVDEDETASEEHEQGDEFEAERR